MESNFTKLSAALSRISTDYRNDPEVRAELDADPRAFFAKQGYELPGGSEIRVVANTPDVVYMTLPPNPNEAISDEALTEVAGGLQAGSLFTIVLSCISTMAPGEAGD